MKRRLFIVGALVGVSLLSACGPATMAIKPEVRSELRSIAIIRIVEPVNYTMFNRGSLMLAAGAVGGAVTAAAAERDAKTVGAAMQRSKFAFGQQLTEDLERTLKAAGYRTVIVQQTRESPAKLLEDYSRVTAPVDAVLDIAIEAVGYSTENWATSPHWRPEAWTHVALYMPKSKEVIYREKLMYGYHNPFMSATKLDAPSQFHFQNQDALLAAGDRILADGLKDAARAIAAHVGNQLKK